ncbi:hypothetical protein QR98_0021730 [Sarcoptes scabiei]|uniref:Uncharacterized protein n=1 Tax=Sarcoptes scabiei TaxID=52283 RepID=A0A131ZYZ6_SARSC|nr:hypothetical protein QR98_0021730 [Sarcoptes scabiei]
MSVINFLFHFVSFNQNFKGENFPTFESEEEEEFADTFDHMSPKKNIHLKQRDDIEIQNDDVDSDEFVIDPPINRNVECRTDAAEIQQSYNDRIKLAANLIEDNKLLSFNEELTLTIFQLQRIVEQMSNRIKTIETKLSDVKRSDEINARNPKKGWPFQELSTRTTLFLVGWPVACFFLMNYLNRLRKK